MLHILFSFHQWWLNEPKNEKTSSGSKAKQNKICAFATPSLMLKTLEMLLLWGTF
jgi:hypothetical protein